MTEYIVCSYCQFQAKYKVSPSSDDGFGRLVKRNINFYACGNHLSRLIDNHLMAGQDINDGLYYYVVRLRE